MVNASPSQVKLLEDLRGQVLDAMHSIEKVRSMRLSTLATIKLGVLRKNATQRHGVTRWQRSHAGELTVETVDLHPHLLCEGWEDYAAFVLYHEFLHALGFRAHDQRFRVLEAMWPHGGSERERRLPTPCEAHVRHGCGNVLLASKHFLVSDREGVGLFVEPAEPSCWMFQ